MSWWNIFKSDVSRLDSSGPPEITVKVPMPKVKPPRSYAPGDVTYINKDISEPVISFVECVRKNPKRFMVKCLKSQASYDFSFYEFTDKHTGQSWEVGVFNFLSHKSYSIKGCRFLTENEKSYLFIEVEKVYQERNKRYESIKNIRERNRLKSIYCKEENK